MSRFDDQLQTLVDTGSLTPEQADALRDASPLKAERDQARTEADAATTRAHTLEQKLAGDVFRDLGLTGSPAAYNPPADVDITDKEQVAKWAADVGLVAPAAPPAVPAEEAAALSRMAAASQGVGNVTPPAGLSPAQKMLSLHEQIKRAGPTQLQSLYSQALDAIQEAGLTLGEVTHGGVEPIADWGATR